MGRHRPLPSQDALLGDFVYYSDTGELIRADGNVGSLNSDGYRVVYYRGKPWRACRLIWVIMTGDDPGVREVDHRNGLNHDDRWDNLRLADRSSQRMNSLPQKRSKTGVRGVCQRSDGKFTATIVARGKYRWLGSHNTLEQAAAARRSAESEMYGEFSANER